LNSGGGVALTNSSVTGVNGPGYTNSNLTLTAGGVLAFAGNTGINVGAVLSPNTDLLI